MIESGTRLSAAAAWSLVSTACAYALQGVPAIGWYFLNAMGAGSTQPAPTRAWPFPALFWTDPVWVGSLSIYAVVLFVVGRRGIATRRLIVGSLIATLLYLFVVAVMPMTWSDQAPWPAPGWVQVPIFAVVMYFNGWILFLAPLLGWHLIRKRLGPIAESDPRAAGTRRS